MLPMPQFSADGLSSRGDLQGFRTERATPFSVLLEVPQAPTDGLSSRWDLQGFRV
jgi:hypothetical protein